MGAVKSIFKSVGGALGLTTPKQEPMEDPSIALEAEEEKKRKAREKALADLNPTGTLGAGTPQTTRSKVLGV